MTNRRAQLLLPALAAVAAIFAGVAPSAAQYQKAEVGSLDKVVDPYQPGEVGVDEQLGHRVPLGDAFIDENGKSVVLNDYFNKGRPIILWLGYYECPMLCDRMSGGMVRAVRDIKLDHGSEFSILQVSINPNEVPDEGKQKKANYLKELQWPGDAKGWDFLTGSPESIKALTDAVGYKFKYIERVKEYAHPAVLVILSPEGKVTRYLYPAGGGELSFDPQTLRLSLIEASDGKVGSTLDKVMLTCLMWDARTGKYTKDAQMLMKLGGGVTVLLMAAILVPLWIRAARHRSDEALPSDGKLAPR